MLCDSGRALGLLIGRELRAPVPDGGVHGEGNDASWLSLVVKSVTHWNPKHRHFIQNMEGLGRAMALDALLLNEDRHAGNILLQPNPNSVELRAWCIDMGNAIVGYPGQFAEAVSDGIVPEPRNLASGIPDIVPLLEEGAQLAAKEATLLGAAQVRSMVLEACKVAREPEDEVLCKALLKRLEDAPRLVEEYLGRIRALQ